RFSTELAKKDVDYLTASRNTVDESNQWNDENDLDLTTLSDTKHEFSKAYGLGVDMGGGERLARSVSLVDQQGIIQYVQIVEEIADEPNYDATLEAIDNL